MPGYWNAHSDRDFEDQCNDPPAEYDDDHDDDPLADYRREMIYAERYDVPGCRWMIPGCFDRADAALLKAFPGFSLDDIKRGLSVPACEETKP